MRHLTKKILSIALLSSIATLHATDCNTCNTCDTCATSCCSTACGCTPHTIYLPRSTGANIAREFLPYAHQFTACFNPGFGVSVGYQQTYESERIARCLFGTPTVTFKGSHADGRAEDTTALLSDYFGMSINSDAAITFTPKIQNVIADFNLYLGLDQLVNGFYLRFHAPLTWSKWTLQSDCSNCCTTVPQEKLDTTDFPAGYMNTIPALPTEEEPQTITPIASLAAALDGQIPFGDKTRPWSFGRFGLIGCPDRTSCKLADVDMIVGYNFWHCDDYHFGLYAQIVAPTGTKINAEHQQYIFTPIIGNGRHWEVGGGISAHAQLWSCEETQAVTLYFEGNMTHMFKNNQVRSFDFTDKGAMSRYMLLKEFNSDGYYTGNLVNAIDYATRCTSVRVNLKADAAIKVIYNNCNWNVGLGYNFYGSTKEKVCIKGTISNLLQSYGFKSVTAVDALGYIIPAGQSSVPEDAIPVTSYSMIQHHGLGTTQNVATITGITTGALVDNMVPLWKESSIDDDGFGYLYPLDTTLAAYESATGNAVISQSGLVEGLEPAPILITSDDFNTCSGAAASQMIHKLFGTIGYSWNDCCWKPFIDCGVEWDLAAHKDCCSAKQWGVWLKGGVSY